MRAEQMASTHPQHWRAVPKATRRDLVGADAVVLVKRVPEETLAEIKKWGGKFIYDPLDFWKQPYDAQGVTDAKTARAKFSDHFENVGAHVVLATNSMMKMDLEPICERVEVLPHHYDPSLYPSKHRQDDLVAYWGHPRYLAEWTVVAQEACKALGIRFKVNPEHPEDAGIMFGVRGGLYGSWLDRRWKSGVKGVTAMRLGIPFVAWPEWSYAEFCKHYICPFNNEWEVKGALEFALNLRHALVPSNEYSVENMARRLEKIVEA